MVESTVPIPQPPGLPFLGNVNSIDPLHPVESFGHLADQYGPIYRMAFPGGKSSIVVSSWELVNEACDESRFAKNVNHVLQQVRNGVHDGLFTARMDEPNWGIAHRVLVPAFGPMSIRNMFDEMHDIASQLALKWAREGPTTPVMVTDDFTRLTLDTLALCAMGYRFNSFYHDEMHPFIRAMGDFLRESGVRSRRALPDMFYRNRDRKYWEDIAVLRQTADGVLQSRKEQPTDRKDLLSAMLEGVDPKTGSKMSDASITDNLITFLIAGHETTSGLLSFAFYNLLKHPEAYRKAQEEVDAVVGSGPVQPDHMPKLHYIAAVLRETLRLTATISAIGVHSLRDQIIGGKYEIKKGEEITLLLSRSQLDPVVYGDDAKEFVPERMLDENFERLTKEFPNCWKPFGNGARACIGRPFAWQEALLVMAVLLQNFNFIMEDPNYQLSIKETLTIKPNEFYMRAALRHGITATDLERRLAGSGSGSGSSAAPATHRSETGVAARPAGKAQQPQGKPMSIYYGSNSGTCESLAQRLASDALSHGFSASVVDPLDAANQTLPTDQPVVIITASYEGEPPDNAAHFVSWLKSLKGRDLDGVCYAVFGCGHHDWAQTFHRVPRLVDSSIEQRGGSRIAPLGLTDCAEGNMFTDFETWEDDILWPALSERYGVPEAAGEETFQSGLTVEVTTPRSSTLRQDVREAVVVATRDLTSSGAAPKKHMEIQLPSEMRYSAGDYLAVLPINPRESIYRAMRRFQLPWDAHITITTEGKTMLPTNSPFPAFDVLGAYVELAQPATKRGIQVVAEAANDDDIKATLRRLAGDDYMAEIASKRVSILDLLEKYPSIALPFETFLSLLPPMRVRQYSISSSPLWNPSHATLTYSILSAPSLSGQGVHEGVASSYLSSLAAGDKLHVAIRPSHAAFHPPTDAERVPVILVAAGTGLAPFRGFIQERAAQLAAGRTLAPALLFFGCRDPELDDLYRQELDRWEKMGAVDVRRAYSRKTEKSDGCKYVQDRLYHDREELVELWGKGARVYVCGSREVGEGVKQVVLRIHKEWATREGKTYTDEEALKWFESIRNERYATDVFD